MPFSRCNSQPNRKDIAPVLDTDNSLPDQTVAFGAGYGASWSEIPADLAQAVMLLAAHYYEFRNETSLSEGCMPFGVTSLIERYKPIRLGGGVR